MGRGMKRILGLCGVSILLMLGCTSTNYPRGDHLLQCCSGCTCNYLGNYRFRIEALGNRWNSYAKPGWDKVPTLEEIALVGAADVALRHQRSYFEILENERTHVWEIGLILGYRRRALHRLGACRAWAPVFAAAGGPIPGLCATGWQTVVGASGFRALQHYFGAPSSPCQAV
jgi:hypothetical protein